MTGALHPSAPRARHLDHWQLQAEPFHPQLRWPEDRRFVYHSSRWQEAIARIEYVSEHQFGLALLSGPAGTGKSLLLKAATDTLARADLTPRLHACRPTQQPLTEPFGPPTSRELRNQFAPSGGRDQPWPGERPQVLLLDDVQLASLSPTQFHASLTQLLQSPRWGCLVLAVPTHQTAAYFEQLSDYAPLLIRLTALANWESAHYLQHRFRQAGGQTALCDEAAAERLHHHSQGMPRWLNRIAHECLLLAAAQNQTEITVDLVEQIAHGLQPHSPSTTPSDYPQLARQTA